MNWRQNKTNESIKTSLYRKIISFLIWGGLFVCMGIMQARYHNSTFINVPINLISRSEAVKANTVIEISTKKSKESETEFKTIPITHWDSIYRMQITPNTGGMNPSESYTIELNSIDSAGLESLPGIGPYTAKKIIAYRSRLGGYLSKYQLLEIPYIDSQIIEHPKLKWSVNTSSLQLIPLDSINAIQLYRHPYIGKLKAKNLIEYCKVHGNLSVSKFMQMRSLNELEKNRLLPYLKFKK